MLSLKGSWFIGPTNQYFSLLIVYLNSLLSVSLLV